jgi:hypothetical protein
MEIDILGDTSSGIVPASPASVPPPAVCLPPPAPAGSCSTRWIAVDPAAASYGAPGRPAARLPQAAAVPAAALQDTCNHPEPYEGDVVRECPADLDFSKAQAVTVSGASWNPCGHMLLCVENRDGRKVYFHVASLHGYPKMMSEEGYRCYLAEHGKHEIRRVDGKLRDPAAAYRKLMEFVSKPWLWTPLPHNCVTFAQQVIEAGGGHYSNPLNCPNAVGVVKSLSVDDIERRIAHWLTK